MSVMGTINKVYTPNSEWPEKEEFLDVIYWSRQIIGLVLGLLWGLLPLKGFIGIFLFAALSAGIVYVWFTAVQVIHCLLTLMMTSLFRVLMRQSMEEPGN